MNNSLSFFVSGPTESGYFNTKPVGAVCRHSVFYAIRCRGLCLICLKKTSQIYKTGCIKMLFSYKTPFFGMKC